MVLEKMQGKFTKYEIARILGARALQLAMDAPVLLKIDPEKLKEMNYDVLKIAELEFEEEVLPITVKRPFPKKVGEVKKVIKEEPKEEKKKEVTEDKEIEKKEEIEEKEVQEEGEIMELAMPEDEAEEGSGEEEGI